MKIETCHNSQIKLIAESEPESVFLEDFLNQAPRGFLKLITIGTDEDSPTNTEERLRDDELPCSQVWGIEINWNNLTNI